MYQETTALRRIQSLNKRLKIIQGGTSASKTISILLYLINKAQTRRNLTISVVAESMPHIKKGALKDFLNIMKTHRYYEEARHNKTDQYYLFPTGTVMEFFGADSGDKVRGPRRDVLFINECNNVPYAVFDQMEVRTKEEIILDYNPVGEFWVHEEVIPHMEHDFVKLTYLDNEALDPAIRASIESRRHNAGWWKVYGLGETGTKEGQIYDGWGQFDDVPDEARLLGYGLDFGYTNHPTAIVAVYRWNNAYVLDEVAYRTGLSNAAIAAILKGVPEGLVVADSAEPKSIDEIKGYGIPIIGAMKGPGSVNTGIQLVQNQTIYSTKRSTNIHKEQRNYMWKTDRDGKPLNVPDDAFNHAMDAVRYKISDVLSGKEPNIRTL